LDTISAFSNLRRLDLAAAENLSGFYVDNGRDSIDKDFDAAEAILQQLSSRKIGNPFDEMTIRVHDCSTPPGWRSVGYSFYPYWYKGTRIFKSGIAASGKYVQWGSSRCE
jgi:hypothetical protein